MTTAARSDADFRTTVHAIPFSPTTENGAGFLPPIIRALGHILYILGCLAAEDVTVAEADAVTEITHAKGHWDARVVPASVSTAAATRGIAISELFTLAQDGFTRWPEDHRVDNLRELANRIVDYTAFLDRELTGVTGSDAGRML